MNKILKETIRERKKYCKEVNSGSLITLSTTQRKRTHW